MIGKLYYLKAVKNSEEAMAGAGFGSPSILVRAAAELDCAHWDAYVSKHPQASLYHQYAWRNVIAQTYGHTSHYLVAKRSTLRAVAPGGDFAVEHPGDHIAGVLPLIHINSAIFGSNLISMPFMDFGGILADDVEVERQLVQMAISLGRELKASTVELRHLHPLSPSSVSESLEGETPVGFSTKTEKVRMVLELPESPEILMSSFKSKLRSQIKKALSAGLHCRIGGSELLGDFYRVFSTNMRDLGSPVHSKKLMRQTLTAFPDQARVFVVYVDRKPVACSLVIGFQYVLENPWASSLRRYSPLSPNMFLYWKMLEYACQNGYSIFDFGRSSLGEGTYKFKTQWGARADALYWHYIHLNRAERAESHSGKARFSTFIDLWKRMPVGVSTILGPVIRKQIGL